jgi:hypothetical protein
MNQPMKCPFNMKTKLTYGLLKIIREQTGKSRYVINQVLTGKKVDPELRERIAQIIEGERIRQEEFLANLPVEV